MVDVLIGQAAALLLPIFGTIITAAIAYGVKQLRDLTGVKVEQKHADMLARAITTGVSGFVTDMAAKGQKVTVDDAVKYGRAYASQSVPDAIRALQPTAEVFAQLGKRALAEQITRVTGVTPGGIVDIIEDPLGEFEQELRKRLGGRSSGTLSGPTR